MNRPENLKVGDKFVVKVDGTFSKGSIIELYSDDASNNPLFKLLEGSTPYTNGPKGSAGAYINFKKLEPYISEAPEVSEGLAAQSLDELVEENLSLEKQIEKIKARLNRKIAFHTQNREEIQRRTSSALVAL